MFMKNPDDCDDGDNNNSVKLISLLYVPSKPLQGYLQKQQCRCY
jgi:hypothetical protein